MHNIYLHVAITRPRENPAGKKGDRYVPRMYYPKTLFYLYNVHVAFLIPVCRSLMTTITYLPYAYVFGARTLIRKTHTATHAYTHSFAKIIYIIIAKRNSPLASSLQLSFFLLDQKIERRRLCLNFYVYL